jgi:hypothetical protein
MDDSLEKPGAISTSESVNHEEESSGEEDGGRLDWTTLM